MLYHVSKRQSRTSWNASASTLHLQHHCSPNEKHTSRRGRILRRLFLHGDMADLGIYESDGLPGLNHHFDEAAWGCHSCGPVVQGLRTHPVCDTSPSVKLSHIYFSHEQCFSLRELTQMCPLCAQRTQTTVNRLFCTAPTRRWPSPWSWGNWAESQWSEFLASSGKIYIERMQ